MEHVFTLSDLSKRFPTDDACLEEIKRLRYPKGITCIHCLTITKHYKIRGRTAYECEYCRNHAYPLAHTIFAKSTTPLRIWFYAMFLMIGTRGSISVKKLQQELGVTYKTAWRMYQQITLLMLQNNADLLAKSTEIFKWTLFNTLEFKLVQKQEKL